MESRLERIFTIVFTAIGAAFLIPLIIVRFVWDGATPEAHEEYKILCLVFAFLAAIFLIIGLSAFFMGKRKKARMTRLKEYGEGYDAEIVRIYDNFAVRVNFECPVIVECVYKNKEGRTVLVKSKNIWPPSRFSDMKDIKGVVWVNPSDPSDYYVEVLFGDGYDKDRAAQYDYDYR